ncbi:hypothetical protein MMC27_008260 [Xylographa pallens]|nr:hypothetical protein [Xylographa pallens]
MAEVLGVVASGISIAGLAIQIASSVQQILDFWASMKGAPTDIQTLLEELDLLAEILSTVDGNTDNDETSPRQNTTLKAAQYCQNAASCIDAVVKDLSDGFAMPRGRRHWTAVKAVLKDKKMVKCLQRLERAKTMLSLAQQCYAQSQIRALQEFQRQKLQAIENLLKVPVSQCNVAHIAGHEASTSKSTNAAVASNIRGSHTTKKQAENVTYWLPLGTLIVRSRQSDQGQVDADEEDVKRRDYEFRPRPWIFRRGFSIFATQLYGLWQYSFRSYRIITMQDPIYAACVSGDLGSVQRLCSQGKASPFDRTSSGWTLLHVAAALADAKLCQWLIGQGLDGTLSGKLEGLPEYGALFQMGLTPLHVIANCSGRLSYTSSTHLDCTLNTIIASHHRDVPDRHLYQADILDTFRVLIEQGQSDPMAIDIHGNSALHLYTGSWNDFHYLLNQGNYHVDIIQLADHGLSLAQHHAQWAWPTSSRIATFAFEQEKLLEAQYHSPQNPRALPKSSEISILQGAVRFMIQHYDGTRSSVEYAISLVRQLISSGIDLHGVIYHPRLETEFTAIDLITMMTLLTGPHDTEENMQEAEARLIPCFKLWLNILRDANIDVKRYLSEEERLASSKKQRDAWSSTVFGCQYRADWHVSLNEDEQDFSISIKYVRREKAIPMVESSIPGGWVEDI